MTHTHTLSPSKYSPYQIIFNLSFVLVITLVNFDVYVWPAIFFIPLQYTELIICVLFCICWDIYFGQMKWENVNESHNCYENDEVSKEYITRFYNYTLFEYKYLQKKLEWMKNSTKVKCISCINPWKSPVCPPYIHTTITVEISILKPVRNYKEWPLLKRNKEDSQIEHQYFLSMPHLI